MRTWPHTARAFPLPGVRYISISLKDWRRRKERVRKDEQKRLKKEAGLTKKLREAGKQKDTRIKALEMRASHFRALKDSKNAEIARLNLSICHSEALCSILIKRLGGSVDVAGQDWVKAIEDRRSIVVKTDEAGTFSFMEADIAREKEAEKE